jgi:hypothetical protein
MNIDWKNEHKKNYETYRCQAAQPDILLQQSACAGQFTDSRYIDEEIMLWQPCRHCFVKQFRAQEMHGSSEEEEQSATESGGSSQSPFAGSRLWICGHGRKLQSWNSLYQLR